MDALVEVLAQIKHSKDENGSRYAVKRLAELLRDEEGFVDKLAARSPEQGELFHLWDLGLVKNASPQYVENLSSVFESLMKHPGPIGEQVCEQLIQSRRIRMLYNLLSSGNRTKVSCGLILMMCVADRGARFVTRMLRQFDFSLNALKVVGVPPKVSGGKMMNAADEEGDGLYARRLWESKDLSKRPTRVAFVQFFKSMVSNCDELRLPLLLSMKYFTSNVIHYISRDPYEVQLMVLSVVKTCVLEQPSDLLTPPTKAAVFSEKFVGQLVAIVQRSGDNNSAEEVAHEASLLLTKILTDPSLGIADGSISLQQCLFYDNLSIAKSSKRRVLKTLLGIKPTQSHMLFLLLQRVFESDPVIALLYLSDMSLDIEPRGTSSFAANSAIAIFALDTVIRRLKHVGFVDVFERQVLLANWTTVMFSKMSRASMSKGIQHASPFVAHTSALILERILESLHIVLVFLERADELEGIDCIGDKLRRIARKHVPDIQLVVAYHSKVCDDQTSNTERSIKRSGSLNLLRVWINAFPESLTESNLQIDKLVPDTIGALHSQNQKEYMQLMNTATQHSKYSTLSPKFDSILKLSFEDRVGQGDCGGVSSLSHQWLVDQLCSTKIFCQGSSGVLVWLDNLPGDSLFVLDFFVDAAKATIRRPTHYFEILSQACDKSSIPSGMHLDPSEVTPLFACAVQRACRILKSKRDAGDKTKVLLFLKNVLLSSLLISVKPFSYIALLMHVLEEEISQETSGKNKKRKHTSSAEFLPELILQLCQELEQRSYDWVLNIIEDFQNSNTDKKMKKTKKTKKSTSGSHTNIQVDEVGWGSYDLPLSRTLSCISRNPVRSFMKIKYYPGFSQVESSAQSVRSFLFSDVEQFMTCFQHFLLFGIPEEVACTTIDVVDSIKVYVSNSEENTSKVIEAFFGKRTGSFWQCLGNRLERADPSVTGAVRQIILCFASMASDSKDALYASTIASYENGNLEHNLSTQIWENRGIVLCLLIEQCRSSLEIVELDGIASCITDLIGKMFESSDSDYFYAASDAISRVFLKKIQMSEKINPQIVSEVAGALWVQLEKHGINEIRTRHVPILVMFGSLYVLMDSREAPGQELARLATSIVDGLFLHLDESRCVTTLMALAKLTKPNILSRNLIEHLEKAKSEETKYKRRLGLARLVPILDEFLSINSVVLSEEVLSELKAAYFKVLMQYVFSKKEVDVKGCSEEEKVAFERLESSLIPAINKLQCVEQWDTKQIVDFLRINPEKVFAATEFIGNPSLRSKVDVLRIFAVELGRASQPSSSDINIPEFTCQTSKWTMRAIVLCMQNNHQVLAPLFELLNSLGDLLAGFTEEERLAQYLKPLIYTLTKEVFPTILTIFPSDIALWRELRRFIAALVPQEDSENVSNGNCQMENDMYRDLVTVFMYIISHNNLLECLQDTTICGVEIPKECLSNHLPLGTLTGCVSLSSSATWQNNQVQLSSATGTIKNEICEILETIIDLISHLESRIASELQSDYIESFRTGEHALLQYLLAAYGASLSTTDMAVWSLIKCLNERAWKRERASDGYFDSDHVACSMEAIMKGPIAKLKFRWGKAVLSSSGLKINPIRCAMLCANFPEWRRVSESDRLPDNALTSEIAPEYQMNYEKAAYDPSFLLPMCLYSLQNDTIEYEDIIDSLLLPVLLRSLGSGDMYIRGIALECLCLLEVKAVNPLPTESSHHEVDRVKLLLGWVKNSIETPFQRIPAMHAIYAAETSVALFNPTSLLYSNITRALTKTPQLDCNSIPQMFKFILRNSSFSAERQWLGKMLICGLRTANDVYLYRKSHVFEISMHVSSSSQENRSLKRLSLLLLERACHIPKAARVMAESCGFPSWLAKKIIDDSEICIELRMDSLLDSLRMSVNAWKAMCSWKSVARGSRRDQYHIQEDLMLSANRIRIMLELYHNELFNSRRGRVIHEMLEELVQGSKDMESA